MLNGGMGDSIAQFLVRNHPVPVEMIGVNDVFGVSGKPEELLKAYGLDVSDIVSAARRAIDRKRTT
jgi:transketolase